jgi:hypothetical protein
MIGILGSGFGLYGYLPAVIAVCKQMVLLPERYRERFHNRDALKRFAGMIFWLKNEDEILEKAHMIIIAKRPFEQIYLINQCFSYNNIKRLIVEKPLAVNPAESLLLLTCLENSGKFFQIGYNFRYTSWGKEIISSINNGKGLKKIAIKWYFRAHHFLHNLNNWKRYDSLGGGVLRFYGIHLIALLAEMGFNEVVSSGLEGLPDESRRWYAVMMGKAGIVCEIDIDCDSNIKEFAIQVNYESYNRLIKLDGPFTENLTSLDRIDVRYNVLTSLIKDAISDDRWPSWYRESIYLWNQVEDVIFARNKR